MTKTAPATVSLADLLKSGKLATMKHDMKGASALASSLSCKAEKFLSK